MSETTASGTNSALQTFEQAVIRAPSLANASRSSLRVALFWFCIALCLTLVNELVWLKRPITYAAAWGASQQAIMARNFAREGVIALKGIPNQNNPPHGSQPDAYIHWPPLPPIALGLAFRFFGETEAVMHGLMLGLLLLTTLALFLLVQFCCNTQTGLWAATFLLLMPITLTHAHLNTPQNWGNLTIILTLLGFMRATERARHARGWAVFGALMLVIGVFTTWEPLLLPPGLVAVAYFQRNALQKRLAWAYCGVAFLAFVGVLLQFALGSPTLIGDLWKTFLFRANLTRFNGVGFQIHTFVNDVHYGQQSAGLLRRLMVVLIGYAKELRFIGPVPLFCLGWLLYRRFKTRDLSLPRPTVYLLVGLATPWLLWYALMSSQAIHEFMILLAAPVLASITGLFLADRQAFYTQQEPTRARKFAFVLQGAMLLMTLPALSNIRMRIQNPPQFEDWTLPYGRDIRQFTPPDGIVLVATTIIIPTYYAERHVIRGVANDSYVERIRAEAMRVFQTDAIYLALRPDGLKPFPKTLQDYPVIQRTPDLVLLSLTKKNNARAEEGKKARRSRRPAPAFSAICGTAPYTVRPEADAPEAVPARVESQANRGK
jgi:hypothetical protein